MLLDKNKKYLLACSYGPDSMACFYLLQKEGISFDVAHVNYGLRKEAKKETDDLTTYCNKQGVSLYIKYADVDKKKNIENECRKIRYDFFKELCDKYRYAAVVVAHHQDDSIETYLMQKKRQNCPKYFGIAEKTNIFGVDVVRPLLTYSKKELLDICNKNKVPYAIDKSNLEDSYLRNQIRHHVVEKMNDAERAKLLSDIKEDNAKLNVIFDYIANHDVTKIETLQNTDEITYLYCLNDSVKYVGNASISKKQGHEIRKILESKKPNVTCKLSKDLYFVKAYDRAYFLNNLDEDDGFSYIFDCRDEIDNNHIYINLKSDTSNLNIDDNSFPICVRTAKKGDIVTINDYECEARRLFIDWKMPESIRKQWPVILDKTGKVIYIPRYQKDFKNDGKRNFYVKLK